MSCKGMQLFKTMPFFAIDALIAYSRLVSFRLRTKLKLCLFLGGRIIGDYNKNKLCLSHLHLVEVVIQTVLLHLLAVVHPHPLVVHV